MTDQTGGQTPPGWYPDGSGATRYWDGTAWTEHVQPAAPVTPPPAAEQAQPVAAQEPAVQQAAAQQAAVQDPAAQQAAAAATAHHAAAEDPLAVSSAPYAATAPAGDLVADGPTPFYKKWPVLVGILVALVLVVGGAALALGGSDDEDTGPVTPNAQQNSTAGATTPGAAAGAATPQTATAQFTLNCEPTAKLPDSNNSFPFNLTLTTTPDSATGDVEISVTADKSISNNGPTTIEPEQYRFEAAVTVNGEPFQLIGPLNKTSAKGAPDVEDIFKADELPLTAKLSKKAPANGGALNVVVTDVWFNNINNGDTGTDAITDTFDSRCNVSPNPNDAPLPIGLTVPAK